jgi:hypothetical protein
VLLLRKLRSLAGTVAAAGALAGEAPLSIEGEQR